MVSARGSYSVGFENSGEEKKLSPKGQGHWNYDMWKGLLRYFFTTYTLQIYQQSSEEHDVIRYLWKL